MFKSSGSHVIIKPYIFRNVGSTIGTGTVRSCSIQQGSLFAYISLTYTIHCNSSEISQKVMLDSEMWNLEHLALCYSILNDCMVVILQMNNEKICRLPLMSDAWKQHRTTSGDVLK